MSWFVRDGAYAPERIEMNGGRFLIANGYMGYRGTLEEYGQEHLVACTLAGVYDKAGEAWREPVNAPNGLLTKTYCNGQELSTLTATPAAHEQTLDLRSALHARASTFRTAGNAVRISTERFLSLADVHLLVMRYSLCCKQDARIAVVTGIDGGIWDINGPHLTECCWHTEAGTLLFMGRTREKGYPVAVAESIDLRFGEMEIVSAPDSLNRRITWRAEAGKTYTFTKYVSVHTGLDADAPPADAAREESLWADEQGYERLFAGHRDLWRARWEKADVRIEGDPEAQLALRFSIYHLLSVAPVHTDRTSIPARGLSGQVYKGAIFWDTELFMLPFFCYTHPELARNLIRYRCLTLDGARRKAHEYGYRGAFYAWESQETGDDACTLFNITDVFTGRPMRTYFRDRQVHISADIVYAIWQYCELTDDFGILLEGGAEVILECARFFLSYAYFSVEKKRYEILDVTGPDEYHERVHNNAFTNRMVQLTLEIALKMFAELRARHEEFCVALLARLAYGPDLARIEAMSEQIYLPQPDAASAVIEQFDGYHRLEDVSLGELLSRVIDPREYLGGGNGLATTTQILKQADVVAMLAFFRDKYPQDVLRANWEYYEPRTEHGSSLSNCLYALVAAEMGQPDRGYAYFLKTACIDLEGNAKQYVGTLYIGGTHPAANGGAWMAAVLGFGGVRAGADKIIIEPKLPKKWKSLQFTLVWHEQRFKVWISREAIEVQAAESNQEETVFVLQGETLVCGCGQRLVKRFAEELV